MKPSIVVAALFPEIVTTLEGQLHAIVNTKNIMQCSVSSMNGFLVCFDLGIIKELYDAFRMFDKGPEQHASSKSQPNVQMGSSKSKPTLQNELRASKVVPSKDKAKARGSCHYLLPSSFVFACLAVLESTFASVGNPRGERLKERLEQVKNVVKGTVVKSGDSD
jgi:hypothetical protein